MAKLLIQDSYANYNDDATLLANADKVAEIHYDPDSDLVSVHLDTQIGDHNFAFYFNRSEFVKALSDALVEEVL